MSKRGSNSSKAKAAAKKMYSIFEPDDASKGTGTTIDTSEVIPEVFNPDGGVVTMVYHSPPRMAMVKEANRNSTLRAFLSKYDSDDWGGIIGEVAAFFNTEMDGAYSEKALDDIAQDLYWQLCNLNKIIIH
tara:strand:- start:28281 stop:28673 length:393 start_codon:yes stop_codon:yes gene_type:complete